MFSTVEESEECHIQTKKKKKGDFYRLENGTRWSYVDTILG